MKIENLKVGQILKSYKQLCETLGEKYKTGKSKQLQLKDMERYLKYHKEGNKFVIDEIYDKPQNKIDRRKGNVRTKYIDIIEILILNLLMNSKEEKVFLPKHSMLKKLRMINDNYAFCKTRIEKLSAYSNIPKENIMDFYDSTDSTLIRNLETSLDSLQNKMLIIWSKEITICEVIEGYYKSINEKVVYDTYDEPTYVYSENLQLNHREATDDEKRYIVFCEKEIAKEYNLKGKNEIIKYGLWDEFMYKMREKLMPKGIIYYYNSYKILFNYEHIEEELIDTINFILEDSKREEIEIKLNNEIRNKIQDNTVKRHDKAIERFIELSKIIGKVQDKKEYEKCKRRKEAKYIYDGEGLIKLLLDINSNNIKTKIKRTKLSPSSFL